MKCLKHGIIIIIIQNSRPNNNEQKKRTYRIVDFAVPVEHKIKLKESKKKKKEKNDEYLDFTRELKKLWNMKVTVIPVVIRALGTVDTIVEIG